jgi:glycosyltransferase involved in cell wall biosynthesis
MTNKKVTYVVSNINKALAFEWIASYLNKNNFELCFILLNKNDSELETFLKQKKIVVKRIQYRGKKDMLSAIFEVSIFLFRTKPDIVHTHLFDASLVGLIASWINRISRRIHTRHHSTYHHDYHPKMVKYDRLINFLSTEIIAVSENVKNILVQKENVPEKKIRLIHHGFDLDKFDKVPATAIENMKARFNPQNLHPVIGVISRYTEWKGVQFIIPAFKKILATYPEAILILANTEGDYKNEIQFLLKDIPERNYREIIFENNIFALYKLFDIFIHAPIDETSEAFGQIYVEALASGVPSIFTISGIAKEFIQDRKNAFVVSFKNSDAISQALLEIIPGRNTSNILKIIEQGKKDVAEKFSIAKMINSLHELYLT